MGISRHQHFHLADGVFRAGHQVAGDNAVADVQFVHARNLGHRADVDVCQPCPALRVMPAWRTSRPVFRAAPVRGPAGAGAGQGVTARVQLDGVDVQLGRHFDLPQIGIENRLTEMPAT